jgi:beta-glucosidase
MQKYAFGSVLSGGNSDPKAGNSLTAWTDLYDRLQTDAMKTRLAIPLVYGIDSVHGNNNVLGATVFPHNIGLGCTRNAN